ncbi:MAG: hypothetical protein JXQ87_06690 [Bacteroidia bacterium]
MHKFYVSMTSIDLSRDGEKLECSIKLFRDDLELALTESEGEKVLFTLGISESKISNLIDDYMLDHFVLVADDNMERTFIGAEIEEEIVWVYIEYNKPKSNFSLKNTCLMEVFEEQVNIVHLKQGGKVQSELLNLSKNQADFMIN